MASSTVQRNAGKTVALSVTSSSHAAVLIDDNTNDQINYTSFLNTGTSAIAVKWGPTDPGAAVLPAGMTTPLIVATSTTPYYLTAISASATGILYVTPAADQS